MRKGLKKNNKDTINNEKVLHVKGRKFKALQRSILRKKKLSQHNKEIQKKKNDDFLFYLQNSISDENLKDQKNFDLDIIHDIAKKYIDKFNFKLKSCYEKQIDGRPTDKKIEILQDVIKQKKHEFTNGVIIPDIRDSETVEKFRKWNRKKGSLNGLMLFTFTL